MELPADHRKTETIESCGLQVAFLEGAKVALFRGVVASIENATRNPQLGCVFDFTFLFLVV